MKKIIKKWWLWVIIVAIVVVISYIVLQIINEKDNEDKIENIGKAATDYITGIDNAQSHIDEFSYNYETGKVEYRPSTITLEMYNRISKGMTESEVIQILGEGDKLEPEGGNSFMISWGDLTLSNFPYYNIQIIFNKDDKKVISMSQLGLK